MDWLAILGLGIWLFIEHNRTSALKREIQMLADLAQTAARRRELAATVPPTPTAPTAVPTPVIQPTPATGSVRPPLEEVAGLASAASPLGHAARLYAQALANEPPATAPTSPPARRSPPLTRAAAEKWLSENGLAWIGGSALVIGGAFLVGYAAQRGFFGPPMRIAAASLLGLLLVGAGELIRRGRLAGFGGHKLAAAIVSGAGASVLYGAAWAAYALYGFIGWAGCAAILAAIAAGVMGLAFVHGEALALLALGGAFVAPLIAGRGDWSLAALTLYMGVLIAAGASIAWLRRWPAAAWANLVGAGVWALLALGEHDPLKGLLLGAEPLAATVALAWLRPRSAIAKTGAGSVGVASAIALAALVSADPMATPLVANVLAGLAVPWLAAALQRRNLAPSWILAGPGVALALAVIIARAQGLQSPALIALWILQGSSLAAAGLWAAWDRERRAAASGAAALGALAIGLAAGADLNAGPFAPAGPAAACLVLLAGTLLLARTGRRAPDRDALEIWGAAAAAALLATLAVGLSWRFAALGFAAATLGLAAIQHRLQWKGLAASAATAGGLGLTALLLPPLLHDALSGGGGAGWMLAVSLSVAAAAFLAARLVEGEPRFVEALRTISPMAALVGAFIFLRWLAGARTGLPLNPLTEASVRTLLIGAAGLIGLVRIEGETLRFARWRAHGLLLAAGAHALVLQVGLYNPRWDADGDIVGGIVFLNTLAIAYLAPALLFATAAVRAYRYARPAGRTYAALAALFLVLWISLEIRRLTHGGQLGGDILTIHIGEALACAIVLLVAAAGAPFTTSLLAERLEHPVWDDLTRCLPALRWAAVGFCVVMLGYWSNPCWGPAGEPLSSWAAIVGVFLGYAAAVALLGRLALDARRSPDSAALADGALVGAMTLMVVLATMVVRSVFHGPDLSLARATGSLETWTYSAVWAAIGLAFVGASRVGGRLFLRAGLVLLLFATAKVFIFDTARLSGAVRAGSFLAIGVLLLLGALTARRIGQTTVPASPEPPQS